MKGLTVPGLYQGTASAVPLHQQFVWALAPESARNKPGLYQPYRPG
jgi:hypothetical protein